jgi:hypothetical protein
MFPDLQRGWLQSHWLDLHWIEADLTIWTDQIPERNKQTNNVAQKWRTTKVAQRWRNHKIKNEIDVKITYFNKREREKRVRGVILDQKLTLNHPSLVDEEKKLGFWWRLTREKKEKERHFWQVDNAASLAATLIILPFILFILPFK